MLEQKTRLAVCSKVLLKQIKTFRKEAAINKLQYVGFGAPFPQSELSAPIPRTIPPSQSSVGSAFLPQQEPHMNYPALRASEEEKEGEFLPPCACLDPWISLAPSLWC